MSDKVDHLLRAYATVRLDDQRLQLHYYHFAGPENYSGTALLVLHPSPLSARFMLPLCEQLARHCPVYAIDTAGYGGSDPLPENYLQASPVIAPYARLLVELVSALQLQQPLVYGSATGAQIAIAAGLLAPEKFTGLLLENVAWLYPEEVAEFEQHYFPSLEPVANGAQLERAWDIASKLFTHFPWYKNDEAHRIGDGQLPPSVIQDTALHYLQAGSHYAHAYRAAMANEHPDTLRALRLPTRILHWQGSLLRQYTARLLGVDLGPCVKIAAVDASLEARHEALALALSEWIA